MSLRTDLINYDFCFYDSSTFLFLFYLTTFRTNHSCSGGRKDLHWKTSIESPGFPDAEDRVSSYLSWIKCHAFNNSCLSSLEYAFPENYLYTRAPTQALHHGADDDSQSLIFQELMELFDKLFPFACVVSLNVLNILISRWIPGPGECLVLQKHDCNRFFKYFWLKFVCERLTEFDFRS